MIGIILTGVVVLAVTLVFYIKWKQSFFTRLGIFQVEPHFLFGHIREVALRQVSLGENSKKMYLNLKAQGLKHAGVYSFTSPFYVPIDREIIKSILVKDFSHFVNHGLYFNDKREPLTGHLFNLEDERWRNLRVKLTPTFTSGKMKMMFQTFVDCTVGLKDLLDDATVKKEAIDIKDVMGRFTTDIIGSCAFGIECNSQKNPNSEFRQYGKRIFTPETLGRKIKVALMLTLPPAVLEFFKMNLNEDEVNEFILKIVNETVTYREKNNIYRKDFLHLLIQLKNMGEVTDGTELKNDKSKSQMGGLSMDELAAQVFVFFTAGFETSSTTMTFALLELATNPDVQQRLREEIEEVLSRHDGQVTYDAIMEMQYLDRLINETLRKYPPVPLIPRICTKDYQIPGTDITLKEGTPVSIAVKGIHYDPEYYPDPENFEPDRFLEENKSQRPAMTFLPFGEGPRMCIGLRFGVLQSKVGLVTAIRNFQISLNEKTKMPIELGEEFITTVKGGVWLNTTKI